MRLIDPPSVLGKEKLMELARSEELGGYGYDSVKNVMQPRLLKILKQKKRESDANKKISDRREEESNPSDQDTDSIISDIAAQEENESDDEAQANAWGKARKCCPCFKASKSNEKASDGNDKMSDSEAAG
jgi:hypothetical protein